MNAITPRSKPIDPSATAPFDASRIARDLLRTCRTIALATLDRDSGYPYSTMTNLSVEPDGTPVFYAAGVTLHARNILADARISMTLAQVDGIDVVSDRRMTLVGRAILCSGDVEAAARARYRRRFPKALAYTSLGDAMFFRLEPHGIHLNGGAARNTDALTHDDLRCDLTGADDLVAHEEDEIARLQADRDTLAFLTERAGGARGRWRIATIDPEGIDMAAEKAMHRLWFPRRITTRAGLHDILTELRSLPQTCLRP